MPGLWADGWFYISSAGLLVSGVLFFFLLGQYRAASEAADVGASGLDAAAAAVHPVLVRDGPAAAPVASIAAAGDAGAPSPRKAGADAPEPRLKAPADADGGASPAVAYLQNIRGELAELHQEMRALAKRVDADFGAVSARDEALVERLGELVRAVDGLRAAGPASAEASAPATVREPAPAPRADETIRLEPGGAAGAALAEKEPPAQSPPPAEPADAAAPDPSPRSSPEPEEKPRRGPVWPV